MGWIGAHTGDFDLFIDTPQEQINIVANAGKGFRGEKNIAAIKASELVC